MLNDKFEKDTLGHLMADNFLKVPVYQRPFTWEHPPLDDFFGDIRGSNLYYYFLGTIILTDLGDYIELPGGQQRIAIISKKTHNEYHKQLRNYGLIDPKMNSKIRETSFLSKKQTYRLSETMTTKYSSGFGKGDIEKIEKSQKEFAESSLEI